MRGKIKCVTEVAGGEGVYIYVYTVQVFAVTGLRVGSDLSWFLWHNIQSCDCMYAQVSARSSQSLVTCKADDTWNYLKCTRVYILDFECSVGCQWLDFGTLKLVSRTWTHPLLGYICPFSKNNCPY